jgi:hypothetical protein
MSPEYEDEQPGEECAHRPTLADSLSDETSARRHGRWTGTPRSAPRAGD